MKVIMLMFDSLNRRMLQPYGCDWVHTPNFQRLAQRTAVFDNSYVGSMPCMPARRELHTGRYNFLHRSWGPLEPFDDSMPRMLRECGVHSHLASDHYHYWEEGGTNYHTKYQTWESFRGQEGDPWKCHLPEINQPEMLGRDSRQPWHRQDWVNRKYMAREEDMSQPKTFAAGLEFLRTNHAHDNWMLHLETFDPHEPFFVPQRFKDLFPHKYDGPHFDWPLYWTVTETPEQVQHCRYMNAALHSMCDYYLGKVLDTMDELDLWKDTMLIVHTDHGFMLGEHDWWAKCNMPFYDEVAHTPLFIWDPRCPQAAGQRRSSLVQTIDMAPTVLECFGMDRPADMQGAVLRQTVADDTTVRQAGLFGLFGGHVNVTDGRYVYMRAPARADNKPLFNYTVMPAHMRDPFGLDELRQAELAPGFGFTKGCPVMKVPNTPHYMAAHQFGTMLFDLQADPKQERPIKDAAIEKRMIDLMISLMKANDAPVEQYQRLGLTS